MPRKPVALLWGAAASLWVSYPYFLYPAGTLPWTHEAYSYVYRLIEFSDCLSAGYLFPQWATHFRKGLGSPYFGYYHPGFFYAASLLRLALPAQRALGAAVLCFSLLGFHGMFRLVGDRFGDLAGLLAGTALVLSAYSGTEIYVRGDLSEYAAMMTLPWLLHWLTRWVEAGTACAWRWIPPGAAALVLLHAFGALLGFALLAVTLAWYGAATGEWRRVAWGAGALALGAAIAAVYWLPVALEWNLVQGARIASKLFSHSLYYVSPVALLGIDDGSGPIPLTLGPVVVALLVLDIVWWATRAATASAAQRRFVSLLWLASAATVFLMSPAAGPLWARLPLLHMIQFPWRLLLVLTVLTSALAAALPVAGRWQALLLVVASAALLIVSAGYRQAKRIVYPYPASAADIAGVFFEPDVAGEWLPRGAVRLGPERAPTAPSCAPDCRVESFERVQGRLRCRVRADGEAGLVLPHYFFARGWRATLDGAEIPLERTAEGLMLLHLPSGTAGVVEVTFSATPMRRAGVALSAVAVAVWLLLARRNPAAHSPYA